MESTEGTPVINNHLFAWVGGSLNMEASFPPLLLIQYPKNTREGSRNHFRAVQKNFPMEKRCKEKFGACGVPASFPLHAGVSDVHA